MGKTALYLMLEKPLNKAIDRFPDLADHVPEFFPLYTSPLNR